MELEDSKDLRECGEVFQVKTPTPDYESSEEISLEIGLHLVTFKNVWNTLITFSNHSKYNGWGLRVKRREMCMGWRWKMKSEKFESLRLEREDEQYLGFL